MVTRNPSAWWAGWRARDLVESVDLHEDPHSLERGGWWAVVVDFEGWSTAGPVPGGRARAWRFADVRREPLEQVPDADPMRWRGPPARAWRTSLGRDAYTAGVRTIRELIREGEVYQVNLCRLLSAPLERPPIGPYPLAALLAAGNPAPYAGVIDLGAPEPGSGDADDEWVVSASPELFLRRDGDVVSSGPIKGTAVDATGLSTKDHAENVMITDLVRNDLQRLCRPGTVEVTSLLRTEVHPGLAHLVSTVQGRLRPGTTWAALLAATSPPGSVSGAPKSSALRAIGALEPVPRGPYCGAVGWVDADAGTGELAVGIRSFCARGGQLTFGTGAGITWGSDPDAEWAETELKAARLVALASSGAGRHLAGSGR